VGEKKHGGQTVLRLHELCRRSKQERERIQEKKTQVKGGKGGALQKGVGESVAARTVSILLSLMKWTSQGRRGAKVRSSEVHRGLERTKEEKTKGKVKESRSFSSPNRGSRGKKTKTAAKYWRTSTREQGRKDIEVLLEATFWGAFKERKEGERHPNRGSGEAGTRKYTQAGSDRVYISSRHWGYKQRRGVREPLAAEWHKEGEGGGT